MLSFFFPTFSLITLYSFSLVTFYLILSLSTHFFSLLSLSSFSLITIFLFIIYISLHFLSHNRTEGRLENICRGRSNKPRPKLRLGQRAGTVMWSARIVIVMTYMEGFVLQLFWRIGTHIVIVLIGRNPAHSDLTTVEPALSMFWRIRTHSVIVLIGWVTYSDLATVEPMGTEKKIYIYIYI